MALKVSQASEIPAFLAMQVMKRAKEMQAAGSDLVHLEVGQPSTPPPAAVSNALHASFETCCVAWLFGWFGIA
jgi:aspartate/methionine/tyrosine aminotransferase